MNKAGVLTKALATVGALLVWLPILATVVAAVAGSIGGRTFRFDYLMPAELFPVAFAGGGLLLCAALRARSRRGLIGWGLGLVLVLLVGGQMLPAARGQASSETQPAGWWWFLAIALLVAYTLALVAVGVAGALLVREVLHPGENGGSPAIPPA